MFKLIKKVKKKSRAKVIGRIRTLKIILPLLILLVIGGVMVYDASIAEAQSLFADKYYFARLQAIWIGIGLGGAVLASKIPVRWWLKFSPFLLGGSLLLLVLVLWPGLGIEVQGARRWLQLGPVSFQPSEMVKLTLVLYLASWLKTGAKIKHFLLLLIVLLTLLLLQPDLGTTVVLLATAFLMLFVSGASLKSMVPIGLVGLMGVIGLIVFSPYRLQRLKTFLDPTQDIQGSSYHINQILLSLGSGQWFGLGLGRSRQKFRYLPEATTDSIFAVLGEELGFIGAGLLIVLFFILFYQLLRIAWREPDQQRKLLATGLGGWLMIQTVVNLAGMVALLPLTGVPLPFISYGRSSLLMQLVSIGILMRISLTQR